jgi:Holliday junction resolvase RusA-like endonuclease
MPQMLTFRVDGEPVAQPRHRIASRGRFATAYIPKGHAIHAWKWAIEEAAREEAERVGWVPVKGVALSVSMVFSFEQPKSNTTQWHTQRPDLDNLAKAVLDALHGIAFLDDAVVDEMKLRKQWRDKPGLWVEVGS